MPSDALVGLAGRIGAYAWPGFLAVLATLVLACGLAGWRLRRTPPKGARQREPDARRLVIALAAGLACVLGLAAVFAQLAAGLGEDRPMARIDLALSRAIALHTPRGAREAFAWLTHLGDPVLLTALGTGIAVALWRARQRGFALGWVLALAGNGVLNVSLKQVFERLRPMHDPGLAAASGFSFPSGHSSGAAVGYGMLAYLAWRLLPAPWHAPAFTAAAAIVLTTAASRVFLQVHFASDVLAGLCSGLAWLAVCIGSMEWAAQRRRIAAAG